ncbi:MAG TPA: UvrD-helicase domain-containing protein [Candidatus Paceibacterota bacterium]|nr:UvrD-helicase domain-containing protein [Candidatus Paceibacterota bacterium]
MNPLDGLNSRQKEAVLHTDGPLLIVAGAGAGKTKTITHRIAYLISQGVSPRSILAVTFTNKAAGEMRERVRALLPSDSPVPLMTTFHSLGVRLLREFHADAHLPRGFSIWDRDDSTRSIKRILENADLGNWTPRQMISAISRQKGDGITVETYAQGVHSYREEAIARVWREYEKTLAEEHALDFDDLLARALSLIETNEHVRALLQNRWRYLTIDEYQDTNKIQYEMAVLLAGERRNLCVVGDIDQNIYSWRGADIAHLISFEKSFPGTKVVLLEQNYRSTRTILAAANAVIEKNTRRLEKNLFTDNPTGDPISLYGAVNELDEAWFIAQKAAELIEGGEKAGEIAVLYRENFQSRALEEAMLALGVPYRVLGTRFFERKEVKDTLSYIRAALNPESSVDLSRIISVPPRGIGKTTLDKILRHEEAGLPASARAKIVAFRTMLDNIQKSNETLPASEAVRFALEVSGMERMYRDDQKEGEERLENIRELVNLAVRYDDLPPPEGIERLLEEAALQSDQDELAEKREAVSLMTVHASKGLEFEVVFITGLEQGLFPSTRAGDASDAKRDPEEERRLFYVALTRARKQLFLTYALQRMKYGEREFTLPSEFFEDIDERLTTVLSRENQSSQGGLIDY